MVGELVLPAKPALQAPCDGSSGGDRGMLPGAASGPESFIW